MRCETRNARVERRSDLGANRDGDDERKPRLPAPRSRPACSARVPIGSDTFAFHDTFAFQSRQGRRDHRTARPGPPRLQAGLGARPSIHGRTLEPRHSLLSSRTPPRGDRRLPASPRQFHESPDPGPSVLPPCAGAPRAGRPIVRSCQCRESGIVPKYLNGRLTVRELLRSPPCTLTRRASEGLSHFAARTCDNPRWRVGLVWSEPAGDRAEAPSILRSWDDPEKADAKGDDQARVLRDQLKRDC